MPDAFSAFLDAPSSATFVQLRADLLATPGFDFSSDAVAELSALVDAGEYAAVPDKFAELMPDWLLSPRAHGLAAHAAEQTGDTERAQFERDMATACLRGLLASGDGSRARPYRVMHVADEYDLLESLGKTFAVQRQVGGADGSFDVITSADGVELWFDIGTGTAP